LTSDQFPTSYNPSSGYVTTSNEMNLPPNYPYKDRKLGFEWAVPFRHHRIDEVLSELNKVSIEDSMHLQNDVVSIPAQRLLALLQPLSNDDAATKSALTLLKGWKASEDADSPQAALYEVWFSRHLREAFKQAVLSKAAADSFEFPDTAAMLDGLETPEARFTGNPVEQRDRLLLTTLASAYQEMEKLQGSDPNEWRWGRLHHNLSEHPLSAIVDEATRARLNVGPLERSGGAYTPNVTHYRLSDFRDTAGPSIRIVVDLGNWDNSRAVNNPGQSGDPDSPHYRDLAPLWRSGQYFPLLYTRKAVESATERKINLVPRPRPAHDPVPGSGPRHTARRALSPRESWHRYIHPAGVVHQPDVCMSPRFRDETQQTNCLRGRSGRGCAKLPLLCSPRRRFSVSQ
jgi:penicillin G amidase